MIYLSFGILGILRLSEWCLARMTQIMLVSVRLVGDGLAGGTTASVTYITYPLDVVRTRLATQVTSVMCPV